MPTEDGTIGSVYEVVAEHPDGRITLRFTEGVLAGRTVTAFTDEHCDIAHARPLTPREKAERLLVSLLDPQQRLAWSAKRRFRLGTPYGVLELGALHNMSFWPKGPHWDPGHPKLLYLCVVPRGDLQRLPEADIWTNLLLVVRAEPERFFAVANWRAPSHTSWYRPPIAGLRLGQALLQHN
ncbi:MAG TPA: hypothetical protein VGG09_14750 [Acidimicrobiales bacterium]|jgi:hypothetical protein